jgi:hypothetical protein
MKEVDYSDKAITMRLRRVSQLRKLCLSLSRSRPLPTRGATPASADPATEQPSNPATGQPGNPASG